MNPHKVSQIPEEYLHPLNLNGLNGRFLRIPRPRKKREILLIYGHHSSLERYYGLAEDLSQYGTLTMPDLPGFGGMDSLYSIGVEATIDELADYLAAVVKLIYKNRQFTLAGFSIGSAITTRMLQKYPEIAARVDLYLSVAGFTHYEDFKISERHKQFYMNVSRAFVPKWSAMLFRYVILNGLILKSFYRFMPNAKHKFKDMSKDEFKRMINFEVELWQNNDVQTYMKTAREMFLLDLTREKVKLAVHNITLGKADQYFDSKSVTRNMKKIFSSYDVEVAKMKTHMPSVIADKSETVGLIPIASRKLLARAPKKLRTTV